MLDNNPQWCGISMFDVPDMSLECHCVEPGRKEKNHSCFCRSSVGLRLERGSSLNLKHTRNSVAYIKIAQENGWGMSILKWQ